MELLGAIVAALVVVALLNRPQAPVTTATPPDGSGGGRPAPHEPGFAIVGTPSGADFTPPAGAGVGGGPELATLNVPATSGVVLQGPPVANIDLLDGPGGRRREEA